jgi:hypothetical protein
MDSSALRIEVEPAMAPHPEAEWEDSEEETGGASASEEAGEATEDGSTRLQTGEKVITINMADSTRLS